MSDLNAAKSVRIVVTLDDIAKGKPFEPRYCPVARAAKRAFRARNISVEGELELERQGRRWWYRLSPKASEFLERFDEGREVEPFEFTAYLIPEHIEV